jgi:hypothetical protein
MNLNPIIIQRKNLHKKLWDDVHPQNANDLEREIGAYKYDFFEECGFNFPIEVNTAPKLYTLCQSVKEKLNVQDDVWFQIQNRVSIQGNSIVSGNDRFPSIVRLSATAINQLNEDELSFLIGHELGHVINKDVIVLFYFDYKYGKEGAHKDLAHKLKVFQLLSELEADRYAYLACGSLETYITYLYKSRGGLDISTTGISIEQFLEGNHNRAKFFIDGGFMSGDTHPYDAIRIEALYIFAASKDARELSSRMFPLVYYLDHCTL